MADGQNSSAASAGFLPRRVLAVRGRDAAAFLQDVVSANLAQLRAGRPLYGLLLTPQGRLRYDFFLWRGVNRSSIFLDCERRSAAALRRALLVYRLRRAVEIERTDAGIAAFWGARTPPAGACPDPRHPALGARLLHPRPAPPAPAHAAAYRRHRLRLGVPEGAADMPPERSFPLEYGLQHLHALDFRKGCFIGQEVVARGQRLGQRRKSLYPLRFAAKAPPPGTMICAEDGRQMGEVRAALGAHALGLLRRDALAHTLTANGQDFARLEPLWAQAESASSPAAPQDATRPSARAS